MISRSPPQYSRISFTAASGGCSWRCGSRVSWRRRRCFNASGRFPHSASAVRMEHSSARRMVAAYCRVSTDKEDQRSSFASQKAYFEAYIAGCPDWQLYQIYADEGVTGTSTRKRQAFLRMLEDARNGYFSLIVTKEISRFSRNILDTIQYTRELKQLGVGVRFLNDGIDTLEPDAELRLSILGSIAQEESRRTSQRVKWGQTRQMERGVVFGRSLLGYRLEQGRLTVEPEGAALVRRIFFLYGVEGWGAERIAALLQSEGQKTNRGFARWSGSVIRKILKNEKYVGDLVQKKTYTPDYLTHKKRANRGEEPQIVLRDHHEPVIDRPLWEQVQRRLASRGRPGPAGGGRGRHPLSGKIRCGCCGSSFVSRQKIRSDGSRYRYWRCGRACRAGAAGEGCGIGRQISDAAAGEMLHCCLQSLPPIWEEAVRSTACLLHRVTGDGQAAWADMLRALLPSLALGTPEGDAFFREVLEAITVYSDGHVEICLYQLPQRWIFRLGG